MIFAYIFSFKNFIKLHISLVVLPQIIMRPQVTLSMGTEFPGGDHIFEAGGKIK